MLVTYPALGTAHTAGAWVSPAEQGKARTKTTPGGPLPVARRWSRHSSGGAIGSSYLEPSCGFDCA